MCKTLLTAYMTLSAFVTFAIVPISAFAVNDPQITAPTGTALATGSVIKATNEGSIVTTDAETNSLTECQSATMEGILGANSGGAVEATITSASFINGGSVNPECPSSFGSFTVTTNPATNGLPWCLRSTETMNTDEFQIRGGGCSEAARPIRYVRDSTTIGACTYERTGAISGTYRTHAAGTAQVRILHVEFSKVTGSFLCPGAGYLDMKFNLTSEGSPVYIR